MEWYVWVGGAAVIAVGGYVKLKVLGKLLERRRAQQLLKLNSDG